MTIQQPRWFIGLAMTFVVGFGIVPCPSGDFAHAADTNSQDDNTFDRTIAPLLARRCFACHSGADAKGKLDLTRKTSALKGGESEPAIVPGDLKRSQL